MKVLLIDHLQGVEHHPYIIQFIQDGNKIICLENQEIAFLKQHFDSSNIPHNAIINARLFDHVSMGVNFHQGDTMGYCSLPFGIPQDRKNALLDIIVKYFEEHQERISNVMVIAPEDLLTLFPDNIHKIPVQNSIDKANAIAQNQSFLCAQEQEKTIYVSHPFAKELFLSKNNPSLFFSDMEGTILDASNIYQVRNLKALNQYLKDGNILAVVSVAIGAERYHNLLQALLVDIHPKYHQQLLLFKFDTVGYTVDKTISFPFGWFHSKAEIVEPLLQYLQEQGYRVSNIYAAGDSILDDAPLLTKVTQKGGTSSLISSLSNDEIKKILKRQSCDNVSDIDENLSQLLNTKTPSLIDFFTAHDINHQKERPRILSIKKCLSKAQ